MNAVTSLPSLVNPNLPNVSTARFEALSVSASTVAEKLQLLEDRNARDCYGKIVTIQPRLQAERFAAERAMAALTAARAEVRRVNAISDTLIDIAVKVGRLFHFEEIADFENQDDAWLLTIEGLVTAYRARGGFGPQFADRFAEVLVEARMANAELSRATAEYARATSAFSTEYRSLATAVAFGRAVLTQLGVEVPRVMGKRKAKQAETVSPQVATQPTAVESP